MDFQVLPCGCLYSLTTCYGIVAQDSFLFSFPTSVKQACYIDDTMLTRERTHPLLQDTLQTLPEHLQGKEWVVNPQEIQGPGTFVKFGEVVWLGKMWVVPEAVINKTYDYSTPRNRKELQAFVGIQGFGGLLLPTWHSASIPYTT